MKEKRNTPGQGGSRRHDDPPAWLDKSRPVEERRALLDRAIKEVSVARQQARPAKKSAGP